MGSGWSSAGSSPASGRSSRRRARRWRSSRWRTCRARSRSWCSRGPGRRPRGPGSKARSCWSPAASTTAGRRSASWPISSSSGMRPFWPVRRSSPARSPRASGRGGSASTELKRVSRVATATVTDRPRPPDGAPAYQETAGSPARVGVPVMANSTGPGGSELRSRVEICVSPLRAEARAAALAEPVGMSAVGAPLGTTAVVDGPRLTPAEPRAHLPGATPV